MLSNHYPYKPLLTYFERNHKLLIYIDKDYN